MDCMSTILVPPFISLFDRTIVCMLLQTLDIPKMNQINIFKKMLAKYLQ